MFFNKRSKLANTDVSIGTLSSGFIIELRQTLEKKQEKLQ